VTSVSEEISSYYMVRSLKMEYLEKQMIAPAIRALLTNLRALLIFKFEFKSPPYNPVMF